MKKKMIPLVALAALFLAAALFLPPPGRDASTPRQILAGTRGELDELHLKEGTVDVRYTGPAGTKLKVQIIYEGGEPYNYDLNSEGDWETYPLTQGDGAYTVSLLEHKAEDRYTVTYTWTLALALDHPMAPFLRPSQIVNYSDTSKAVILAETLTQNAETDGEKAELLFDYVVDHISYDYEKAASAQPGYLPDVDATLEGGKGICFDYAALLCAMLRSQGIPCRLITGYADGGTLYHAWVEVWGESPTAVDGAIPVTANAWSRLDPTFVSGNGRSGAVLDYVADDGNYEAVSVY